MSILPPKFETLRDLYINELRYLYNAENQLVEALPKMAKASKTPELRKAFESHLRETKQHVNRLTTIFKKMEEDPEGETCKAMKGLVKEGEEYVKAGGSDDVRDAGIIGAAQRVEHYEMAGYGTARNLAQELGEFDAAELLQKTLNEEAAADEKLSAIAEERVNSHAHAA